MLLILLTLITICKGEGKMMYVKKKTSNILMKKSFLPSLTKNDCSWIRIRIIMNNFDFPEERICPGHLGQINPHHNRSLNEKYLPQIVTSKYYHISIIQKSIYLSICLSIYLSVHLITSLANWFIIGIVHEQDSIAGALCNSSL